MESFRTKPPIWYIPPSREEMREAAKGVELKSFAPDLVADLCNLAAGGEIEPPSAYRDLALRQVEDQLPRPDSDGKWKLSNGKWTKSRTEAVNSRFEKALRYHQNVADFLATVDLDQFPGQSPLEQAMGLLKLLSTQSGGSGGENGEPLPIFQDGNPEKLGERLNDLMETVESLSDEESEMLDPEGNWDQDSPEGDGTRSGNNALKALKVAEDLLSDGEKNLTILNISRRLDQMTVLKARKEQKYESDPEGDEVRQRPMRDLSELSRIPASAWALRQQNPTLFWYKAVSQQLTVRERVRRIERKQVIFILCDASGSMEGTKHHKATGVVMNRLKAVISGDAEVYLALFDTQMHQVSHAATPSEAKELLAQFQRKNFSGGGTDIATAIRSAHQQIEELMKSGTVYRPEIMVLTDEDSSVSSLRKEDVLGTTVHGFAMETQNPALVELARATAGVGIENF